jgi:hypothetical protein
MKLPVEKPTGGKHKPDYQRDHGHHKTDEGEEWLPRHRPSLNFFTHETNLRRRA